MYKPLELFIGLRYTRARRRNHFISFITFASMLGVALGVVVMITVISVMNGFERELRAHIVGIASHATISGYSGKLENWATLASFAAQHPSVVGVAPYVHGEAMLTHSGQVQGAVVRGVLPEREPDVSDLVGYMTQGRLEDLREGEFGVLLGEGLAAQLGAGVGAKVTLVVPLATISPAGVLPRLRRFTVVGLFAVNHAQYDTGLAVVHLRDAARLFRLGEDVSGLRLKLDDLYQARRVAREVAAGLDGRFWVTDWTRQHANFFRALRMERVVMFVILSLIVAVAAFNIVSTLIMAVTDKQSDIAILRTLGATPASVMGIFVVQGTVIGLVGTVLGVLGGIALATHTEVLVAAIEGGFGFKFLNPDIYYISDLPSDLRAANIVVIALVAFVMSVLATLYPAWRAARTRPAEALRYE